MSDRFYQLSRFLLLEFWTIPKSMNFVLLKKNNKNSDVMRSLFCCRITWISYHCSIPNSLQIYFVMISVYHVLKMWYFSLVFQNYSVLLVMMISLTICSEYTKISAFNTDNFNCFHLFCIRNLNFFQSLIYSVFWFWRKNCFQDFVFFFSLPFRLFKI